MARFRTRAETPIAIPGLWALIAGNGGSGGDPSAIYFTAATLSQTHGVLGSIQAAPAITTSSVVNAGSLLTGAAPNTILSIFGPNLSPISRAWTTSDFVNGALPTSLDGVSVTINGKPAYVTFVSPKQVNVLAPPDTTVGPVPVVVTNNGLASASASIQLAALAPSFFIFKSNAIAALHADYSHRWRHNSVPELLHACQSRRNDCAVCHGLRRDESGVSDRRNDHASLSACRPCRRSPLAVPQLR